MARRKKSGMIDDVCAMVGGVCGIVGSIIGLIGCFVQHGAAEDDYVERGRNFWGHKYKKRRGICYHCHGTGFVRGKTCSKCGGSGKFSHTTWYE